MLIDWFTVAVQIVNFLILIALLKRFLYGPIVRVMDERRQAIAASLTEAAQAKQAAEEQLAALAEEKEAVANSREALMRQAASDVEAWREATLLRLREEIDESRRLWQRQLTEEQEDFLGKLKIRLGEQVVRVAGKVLEDLADERLETKIFDLFLAKMGTDRALADGQTRPAPPVLLVATGLTLTQDGREGLRRQLAARFGPVTSVIFSEEPGLGFGIRLTAADQSWEWNLAHYMAGFEQEIRQALAVERKSGDSDARDTES